MIVRHARWSARAAALAALAGWATPTPAQPWTTYAGSNQRASTATRSPASITTARWVCSQDLAGNAITFAGQSGVVATSSRVFAIGKAVGVWRLFAIDATSGRVAWQSTVNAPVVDSWSTPTLDLANQSVLVAAGQSLAAFDMNSGSPRWSAALPRSVVNASPLVTDDRGPADRALITDYDGFGAGARLHCINVDPFDAVNNPYQPGQIVWSRAIGGSSGNSPAYAQGTVYVATTGDGAGAGGRVLAFPIEGDAQTPPTWAYVAPPGVGFFGGVTIASTANSVYAASYAFFGDQLAATLVKLNASTGDVRWTTPCNRTSSTPVVLPTGHVVLCGGVQGFGSVPSIELFQDDVTHATLLWDTALATWSDANANGSLDAGEYLAVGGWSTLGIASPAPGAAGPGPAWSLLVGAIPSGTGTAGANADLFRLDLSRAPTDSVFVADHFAGAGSTPAIAIDGPAASLYTIGPAGLYALGGPACYANCDGNTTSPLLSASDFTCFLTRFRAGDPLANCDGTTSAPLLSAADFTCFLSRFRGGCP